ncbi:enoyl-CoA hydratase/isomerase family protein [Alicyclobacillus cycloheptanicus]|uniref:2-(1,2-epoxy-1,2-dihydrophenyl)acetyl-CoA isomerase n=1 Tax=Alicyclobacillus cycloheptanicus TaxID=1457 RepID=A0ABT9XMV4_9BACL|nr:enoyl-CoA hydratase-related protein [Alicyclobacillus cycloheptanicus]MDQ0191026.1 2-(1,2-epoxy-1,2-dihydrophenyl)acetyl-CoA isomerase [Alicyclobacillus cycloheptanicus]WDM00918.1 enoyl-CoA hydratase/isomerase family protein [Alicyclobacillus cycloheptanicus]
MEFQEVLYQVDGGVATVTLNRAEAMNALTRQLRKDLVAALGEAAADANVRAVLLTGAGRGFCVGQDVKELSEDYAKEGPEMGRLVETEYIPIVKALRTMPKPTVALVNGPAVGGGLALALAADFRVITEKSVLNPVFVKVGLAPDSGVSFYLSRMIGFARAVSVTLRGQGISPAEQVALGLASRVNATLEEAQAEAKALLDELANGPTEAYVRIRQLFDQTASLSFEDALVVEKNVQDDLAHTADHMEAVQAFLERRPPNFTGR